MSNKQTTRIRNITSGNTHIIVHWWLQRSRLRKKGLGYHLTKTVHDTNHGIIAKSESHQNYNTVFQAETIALTEAAKFLIKEQVQNKVHNTILLRLPSTHKITTEEKLARIADWMSVETETTNNEMNR